MYVGSPALFSVPDARPFDTARASTVPRFVLDNKCGSAVLTRMNLQDWSRHKASRHYFSLLPATRRAWSTCRASCGLTKTTPASCSTRLTGKLGSVTFVRTPSRFRGMARTGLFSAIRNGVGHPWCGNYLAFRQRPPVDRTCQFEDATMGDVPPLVAYFTECTGASLSKPICSVSWCLLECGMLAQWRNRP